MFSTHRFIALAVFAGILAVACGGNPVQPPPPQNLHDPEVFFHFFYHRDSAGGPLHEEPYPDTAIMTWHRGAYPGNAQDSILATIKITGTDSVCAFFLAPDTTTMFWGVAWKRQGVTSGMYAIFGPFHPGLEDANNPPYWDVSVSEDTVGGGYGADGGSSATHSLCPASLPRDSVVP